MRTRNIIILVDGVPQNGTYDGQFDPRAIPVENIARIKVTRGGSSVLYGPGGNAAVIDIITKAAGPGLQATGDAMVGFGQQKDARVTASYGGDAVSTFISASIYEQDQFHLSDDFSFTTLQPNDARVNSDREDRAIYGNTQIKVNEDIQWGFSINYREGEYGKPPSTWGQTTNNFVPPLAPNECQTPAQFPNCSPFASGVRFERVDDYSALSLQTSGLVDLGGGLTVRPMAYYNANNDLTNRYDNSSFKTQTANNAFSEDASAAIYGGGGQIAFRPDDRNLVTMALDAHRESWEADGFTRSFTVQTQATSPNTCSGPAGPPATGNPATCQGRLTAQCGPRGGTVSGSLTFFNNGTIASRNCTGANFASNRDEDLDIFSAAAEYEVKLTSELSGVVGAGWAEQHRQDSNDGDYTYLAGLRYAFTEDTVLRGNVARKIRFPTLRNLYGTDEGNQNLETEVTQNYEVGLDQRLPFINGLFSVTVFRIDAENFIRKPNTNTCDGVAFTYDPFCNEEKLRFQGVEANLAFSPFAGFNAQVGYTYLDASNEEPSVPGGTSTIDNEPEHKVMAAVSYVIGGGATLLADYQYVAGSFAVARNQIDTLELADYHLLNIGLTQDLGGAYQLYGRVENALDENYESSFGFPEAGRVFFLGLRAKLGPG
jgi:outer membrane receptor protein involved in Fe transport